MTEPSTDPTIAASVDAQQRTPDATPTERTDDVSTSESRDAAGPQTAAQTPAAETPTTFASATPTQSAAAPATSGALEGWNDADVALVVTFVHCFFGIPRHAALERLKGAEDWVFEFLRRAADYWLPGERERRAAVDAEVREIRETCRRYVEAERAAIPQKPIPQKPPIDPLEE